MLNTGTTGLILSIIASIFCHYKFHLCQCMYIGILDHVDNIIVMFVMETLCMVFVCLFKKIKNKKINKNENINLYHFVIDMIIFQMEQQPWCLHHQRYLMVCTWCSIDRIIYHFFCQLSTSFCSGLRIFFFQSCS